MTEKNHSSLVVDQFGPRAQAYLHSAVHAQGVDLQHLVERVQGQSDARVLDLGCGAGHVGFSVAPMVREVVAYDISQNMLDVVKNAAAERGITNLMTQQGTVDHLPFPDHSFDFVFSRYSAHHWLEFSQGLHEARRVLKNDGKVIFIDVVSPGKALLDTYLQSVEFLRDPSHIRNYSPQEWKTAVADLGFTKIALKPLRLHLDFSSWVERMQTPETHIKAIRSLQNLVAVEVLDYFEVEPDGSFTVDTMILEASLN